MRRLLCGLMMSGASQCQRPMPWPRPPPRPPAGRRRRRGRGLAVDGRVQRGRTDAVRTAGPEVEPAEAAVLRLHEHDVRILRIDPRLEAVAAADAVPVAGADPDPVERPRRAADRAVVLGAAADVVERPGVVGVDPVVLRQRQVGEVPPRLHAVVGLVDAAVVGEDDVVLVGRVEHDVVVIDVHARHRHRLPGLAAVGAAVDVGLQRPDGLGVVSVDVDLVVVAGIAAAIAVVAATTTASTLGRRVSGRLLHARIGRSAGRCRRWRRPGAAGPPAATATAHHPSDARPARPGVVRPVEAALTELRRDERVDGARVPPVDAKADPSELHRRQAFGELRPLLAAVGGLVDAALGTAANQLTDGPPALIRRGVEHVGTLRIHHQVGDAGVLADREDGLPRLAAVGGLVEAAIAARRPERPDRGHVDHVRVARIDDDVLDVLGVLEPHALPGLAGIRRLVDAVAEGDAALVVVLAGAEPHHVRVLGVDGHRAERVRAVILEDRRPGVAAILGLPEIAGRRRRIPDVRVPGIDRDVGNAAGGQAGAEAPEFERLEGVDGQAGTALAVQHGDCGQRAGRQQQRAHGDIQTCHGSRLHWR